MIVTLPHASPCLSLAALAAVSATTARAAQPVGIEDHGDIGLVANHGNATYHAADDRYTLSGAGENIWAKKDEFQLPGRRSRATSSSSWRPASSTRASNPTAKRAGSSGPVSTPTRRTPTPRSMATASPRSSTRATKGGPTFQLPSAAVAPDVIQLERKGKMFIMSVARYGEPFTRTDLTELDLGDEVYVGLFVCAHNPKVSERAVFSNVRIVIPPAAGWRPYRDYIGSNLEVMRIDSPDRKVLYTTPGSIQAPNWTRDGKSLIYNGSGRLYRFDLATNTPTVIDTGEAIANNNDHVLSFDGAMLGISHRPSESENSVVYTVPTTGGTPTRITKNAPSYFHGWSPDAKWLVFTGGRNGELDVYKIPAEGGDENSPDDGDRRG